MNNIKVFKEYKEVPILQDKNVIDDGGNVYIGNGQGCSTFWFKDIEKAKRFIDKFRSKMRITDLSCVMGLIPKKLCQNCKCHYSYMTKKWQKSNDWNCKIYKESLRNQV